MVTAENITDKQIRKLRKPASEEGEGCSDGIAGSGRWITAAELITLCDAALADHSLHCGSHTCSTLCGEEYGITRRDARARIADIINTRAAKP